MTAQKIVEDHYPKWLSTEKHYLRSVPPSLQYSTREWTKAFDSALDKKKKGGFKLTPWIMRALTKTGIADLMTPR